MERAVEKADFGPGPRTVIQNKDAASKGAHFAASVEFFTVKCGDKEYKVVGKVQPDNEWTRIMMSSDLQFITEVLMYKEMLPLFGVQDLFPILYYGQAESNPKEDVVLLEDIGVSGFKVTKEKLFLSIEHLRLAVKELGRFHAASFTAKKTKPEEFKALVSRLKYKRFSDEECTIEKCMARGVQPHMDKHGDVLAPALAALQDKNFFEMITKPKEPWAIVCHGDFCRNNIMFKYEGNKPVAVKFFDLQTSRYSSPAIDLSFFLYLNMDKATRDLHWDSLLKDYLESLKSHLPSDITVDEQGFYDDFASRAVYGYYHCSFFSPMMMVENPPLMEDYTTASPEERVQVMISIGGDEGTQLVADIVAHLLEKGYINKFLEFVNSVKK